MIFAVAASVLIVVGLATWAIVRPHRQQIAQAVIDLRDRSVARGTETPPSEPSVEVPHHTAHLEIYLPLGSAEGFYEVRIASFRGESLLTERGEAKIDQGVIKLHVDLGTPLPRPGSYLLQLRKPGAEWVSFPVDIR